jgi:threonine/homoserine/homoserine lactone efflux protein
MIPSGLADIATIFEPLQTLSEFAGSYAAILVTPGPNMLAIGETAALGGLRAAMPLCFGVALGAGCLGAAILFTAGAFFGSPDFHGLAQFTGAALLAYIAVGMLREPRQADLGRVRGARAVGGKVAAFGAGYCIALSNPVTGAFYAAQFLGPLGAAGFQGARMLAIPCVVLMALMFSVSIAWLLGMPSARHAALAWHRPVRIAASVLLGLMAMNMLRPLLGPAPNPGRQIQRSAAPAGEGVEGDQRVSVLHPA